MQTFKKLRPPGHGVDSNAVQRALPKKLKLKVSRRTVRRRLAEKGFVPQKKRSKEGGRGAKEGGGGRDFLLIPPPGQVPVK